MEENKTNYKKAAAQIAIILFGLTCYACGVVFFILPLDMIAAVTTGIALVAEHLWGIPLSGFVAVFNVLMFVIGWFVLGKKFALTTLVATFYYPFILDQIMRLAGDFVVTEDPMLCAVFAGLIIGFSLGIVIRSGASTGGTDIPPLVLKKKLGIPVSATLYVMDFTFLVSQLAFQDREKILYALVMVMIYTVVVDKVLVSGTKQIQVKIISDRCEEISRRIQEELDRGVTLLHTQGGHMRKEAFTILTVVSGRELMKLNEIVTQLSACNMPTVFMLQTFLPSRRRDCFTPTNLSIPTTLSKSTSTASPRTITLAFK